MLACVAAASGMKIYEDTQRSIEEMAGRIMVVSVRWIGFLCGSPPDEFPMRRWWPGSVMRMSAGSAPAGWIESGGKEYRSRRHRGGVLVLSEFWPSLFLRGCLVNPYSNRRMDEAIEAALEMQEDEQHRKTMTAAVEAYTVKDWAEEQLAGFPEVATVG